MQIKQIHPWFRYLFLMGFVLSFIAGIQLFFLSEQTEIYFAWTIQSPLTAATFGGFYFGAMTFGLLSSREVTWAQVRTPAIGLLTFLSITLVTTLLHLDKFHLDSQNSLTLNATRAWFAVYIFLPLFLALAMVFQARAAGGDPELVSIFPLRYRYLLVLHGFTGLIIALILFFAPQSIIPHWPWSLTPLTARALSAWLVSFGVISLQTIRENDWSRVKVTSIGYIVSGFFAIIALIRYEREANLIGIGGLSYAIYLLLMLGIGIYGWRKSQET